MEPIDTTVALRDVPLHDVTRDAFTPYDTLIEASADCMPFGTADAQLDLPQGRPRYYIMRIPSRGFVVDRITRHRRVTQALASVGGADWVVAVAPPCGLDDVAAEPALADIAAFRIPGDVAVMLHKGTWHAGLCSPDRTAASSISNWPTPTRSTTTPACWRHAMAWR